jgi:hypothetical protein
MVACDGGDDGASDWLRRNTTPCSRAAAVSRGVCTGVSV